MKNLLLIDREGKEDEQRSSESSKGEPEVTSSTQLITVAATVRG